MFSKYLIPLVALVVMLSCNKEKEGGTYIVNASKMIAITGNDWNNSESQMKHKIGYNYIIAQPSTGIKAEVQLPALDDSNRVVNGAILLNIALDNRVNYAEFNTENISQPLAYAMMLNYHKETLQSISGITFSIGEVEDNGAGTNPPVSTVLSKLTSGNIVNKLAITYHCTQGSFTMVIFKQADGRFIFSYRGSI